MQPLHNARCIFTHKANVPTIDQIPSLHSARCTPIRLFLLSSIGDNLCPRLFVSFKILLLYSVSLFFAIAQPAILEQRVYTSFDFPVDATIQDSQWLWVATTGGVYRYNLVSDSVESLDPLQMFSIDLTAITYDSTHQRIIVGSNEGFVQLYHLASRQWTVLPEISLKRSEYGNVTINRLFIVNDYLLIGTGFGFVMLHLPSLLFQATVTQLPGISFPNVTAFALWKDSLWVGTSQGLFSAPLSDQWWDNPANPALWRSLPIPLGNTSVRSLVVWNQGLIVGTDRVVFRYDNGSFSQLYQVPYPPLTGLRVANNQLWIADQFEIRNYTADSAFNIFPARLQALATATLSNQVFPILLTQGFSTWILSLQKRTIVRPNAIAARSINDLKLAADGTLWYATDIDLRGRGFGRLRNGHWENFSSSIYEDLETDDWYRLFIQRNGTVWISSWGHGLLEVHPLEDTLTWIRWDHRNAPLTPFQDDFVVIGDVTEDNSGIVWVTNPWGNGFAIRQHGQWKTAFSSLPNSYRFSRIIADPFGGVWAASHLASSGLWFFSFGDDLDDNTDDFYQQLTTTDGLVDNQINTLLFDSNGWLWIGTQKGLSVLLNPQEAAFGGTPLFYTVEGTEGQIILSMVEDATGLLWIGTPSGLWLLDLQSLEIIEVFDESVLPNFDLTILSLAYDAKTGWIYAGTRKALLALRTTSVASLQTMDSVRCFPQPFTPGIDPYLHITNLPAQSTVLIVTTAGDRIREIPANNSATVIWDGKDSDGQWVPTGIYLLLYRSEALGQEGARKIFIRNPW